MEIKFRAWNGRNMINLFAIRSYDGQVLFTSKTNFRERKDVENPIVMQFTGLKDKNGKEIYEGDILNHKYYKTPVVVTFENGCFISEDVSILDNSIEVVGNKFQNPELLQK